MITLILNERQHEFNEEVNLKSLSIIHGTEGDRESERGMDDDNQILFEINIKTATAKIQIILRYKLITQIFFSPPQSSCTCIFLFYAS